MGSSVRIDKAALWRAMKSAPETARAVETATRRIHSRANALGSMFRTGLYHREHQSPAVGNTQAAYDGNVEAHNGTPVGIVHTGNYAAMCDNARNNTLLKSIGG